MVNMSKVIVLGLDGADLDVILKAKDELPSLYHLIKKSSYGYFKSTVPPITVPAWISMFTGKNPAKIGTLSFRKIVKTENGYTSIIAKPTWRGEMLWDYLSLYGYKVAVINVPGTYPAWKVNGIMISGFPSPKISTYPPNLMDKLPKNCVDAEEVTSVSKKLELMKKQTERLVDLILFLAEKKFDLIVCVLRIVDVFLHHVSSLDELVEAYKCIDENINKIVNLIGKSCDYLFIVSDHGSQNVRLKFYPNVWLNKKNYLHFKKELTKKQKIMYMLANFLASKGLKRIVWSTFYYLQKHGLKSIRTSIAAEDTIDNIDWSKTAAFAFGLSGIDCFELWIVDKDKENEILNKIKSITDDTGKRIVKNIFRVDELYNFCPENFPNYIVQLNDGYSCVFGQGSNCITSATGFIHRRDGIFLAYGTDIKGSNFIGHVDITDLTPTILYLFNIPLSEDIDGKAIMEIFKDDLGRLNSKIKYESERDKIRRRIYKAKILNKTVYKVKESTSEI